MPGAALAGIAAGVLIILPYLSVLFFAWIFLAGGAAALAYRSRTGMPLTGGMGAKIGALAGFFVFLIPGLFSFLAALLKPDEMRAQIKQAFETSARSSDPQTVKAMHDFAERATSPEGMMTMVAAGLFLVLCFFIVVSAAGGAAGSTVNRKGRVL
jgi:hypothetical protein